MTTCADDRAGPRCPACARFGRPRRSVVGYAAGQRALARRPPCGVLLKIRALELPLIDRSRAAAGHYSGNA